MISYELWGILTRPLYISQEQVQDILDCVRSDVRTYAIIKILYATGIKVGELRDLPTKNCFFNCFKIVDRIVPLGKNTRAALERYLDNKPYSRSDKMFLTNTGTPIPDNKAVRRIVEYGGSEIGLHIVPSTLRNSFIVHMIEAGVSINTLWQMTGHLTADLLKTKYVWLKRQRYI